MSTFDSASGAADDGLFRAKADSTYNSAGRDPSSFDPDEEFGFTSQTQAMQPGTGLPDLGTSFDDDGSGRRPLRWTGAADFGMLVLRLVVGGTFVTQGLQHLFGLFHGIGIDRFTDFVKVAGYTDPHILAYVAGGTELAAGGLIVLGLFTPVGAGAMLGLLANVIVLKWKLGFFPPAGFQPELVLAATAFALLFVGPGRISLDRPTPWFRRPGVSGIIFLIIAAAVSVVFLEVLRNH